MLQYLYINEIAANATSSIKQEDVAATATTLQGSRDRFGKIRNWAPVLVKQTGIDKYRLIAGRVTFEAMKACGCEKIWCVQTDGTLSEDGIAAARAAFGETN